MVGRVLLCSRERTSSIYKLSRWVVFLRVSVSMPVIRASSIGCHLACDDRDRSVTIDVREMSDVNRESLTSIEAIVLKPHDIGSGSRARGASARHLLHEQSAPRIQDLSRSTSTVSLTMSASFSVSRPEVRRCWSLVRGPGSSPLMLQRAGFCVVGCDLFSETDLAAFRERIGDAAQLVTYDGRRVPLPDASVNVVTSRNVFEHILHVDSMLDELDRVLAPGGVFVLVGPNWSGPHNAIRAALQLCRGADRYWQYESLWQAGVGLLRSFAWDLKVRVERQPRFLLIEPIMRDGKIHFRDSDDDAVHLCHPVSFRKWFTARGYEVVHSTLRIQVARHVERAVSESRDVERAGRFASPVGAEAVMIVAVSFRCRRFRRTESGPVGERMSRIATAAPSSSAPSGPGSQRSSRNRSLVVVMGRPPARTRP